MSLKTNRGLEASIKNDRGAALFRFDANAKAFFAAASISDGIIKTAIHNLVVALKDNAFWALIDVLYPMVGGTGASHAINLKDPSSFVVTWFNDVADTAHSANGYKPNGVNQYGVTGYTNTSITGHISVYSMENVFLANQYDIGVFDAQPTGGITLLGAARDGLKGPVGSVSDGIFSYFKSPLLDNAEGLSLINRTAFNSQNGYFDAVLQRATDPSSNSNIPTGYDIWIGGCNNQGTLFNPSTRQCALYSVGLPFADAAAVTSFTNIVQAFQTDLGRAV